VPSRVFDVAVDAHGAAVHHAACACSRSATNHLPDGTGVHRPVDLVLQAGLPVDRGDVEHHIDARGGALDRAPVAHIADRQTDATRFQGGGRHLLPYQGHDVVAPGRQRPRQVTARETARPRD